MSQRHTFRWKTKKRNCKDLKKFCCSYPCLTHPLRPFSFTKFLLDEPESILHQRSSNDKNISVDGYSKRGSKSSSTTSLSKSEDSKSDSVKAKEQPKFVDPLGATLENGTIADSVEDPLNRLSTLQHLRQESKKRVEFEKIKNTLIDEDGAGSQISDDFSSDDFKSWSVKKAEVLKKFVTNEKLSIVTSFLPGGVPIYSQTTRSDAKLKLEQLDSFSNNRCIQNLSQKDYVEKISDLTKALLKAWSEDQRVQAIKIAIQCSQFLADTSSVPRFYPSQFFIVVDVLDTFGRLVFGRLEQKAVEESGATKFGLANSTVSKIRQIPEGAKEIARNWFYKVVSIRELLPRLYVEISLLPVYRFLNPSELRSSAARLAEMCRGIGDPLATFYARCYLLKVLMSVERLFKDPAWRCFHDCVALLDLLCKDSKKLNFDLDLLVPAFEWVCQFLVYGMNDEDYAVILSLCDQRQNCLLNLCLINGSSPKLVSRKIIDWMRIVKSCFTVSPSTRTSDTNQKLDHWTSLALNSIASALCKAEPSPDLIKPVIKEAWRIFRLFGLERGSANSPYPEKRRNVEMYASCAIAWLRFSCRHFGLKEIDALLDDLVRELRTDKHEQFSADLLLVLEDFLQYAVPKFGFANVVSIDSFAAFTDLFDKSGPKVDAAKHVLNYFCKFVPPYDCDDPRVANLCLTNCQILQSSLNVASSSVDEQKQAAQAICRALDRVDFGRDYERQLSFLVEARGMFCCNASLGGGDDLASAHLVRLVCRLLARLAAEKPSSSRSDAETSLVVRRSTRFNDLARSCVAYIFITIPSINDSFLKLQLYLNSVPLALFNGCLGQADSLLRSALNLLAEIPRERRKGDDKKHAFTLNVSSFVEYTRNFLALLLLVPDLPDKGPLYYTKALLNVALNFDWSDDDSVVKASLLFDFLSFLSCTGQEEYEYEIQNCQSNDKLYSGNQTYTDACDAMATDLLPVILDCLQNVASYKENADQDAIKQQATLCLDLLEIIIAKGNLSYEQRDRGPLPLAINLWNLTSKSKVQSVLKRRSGIINRLKRELAINSDLQQLYDVLSTRR